MQAYAVRERDGFNLIDTSTADQHDDHTGSAAALLARTGARVVAPRDDAPVITRHCRGPAPQLCRLGGPAVQASAEEVPVAVELRGGRPVSEIVSGG